MRTEQEIKNMYAEIRAELDESKQFSGEWWCCREQLVVLDYVLGNAPSEEY